MSTNYANLTKEQLIQKLSFYERSGKISNATVLNKASLSLSPRKTSKKKETQFDFTKTVARKVAFRLSYLGTGYHGFSGTLKDMENGLSTIEGELFKALMTCRLIPEPDLCEWSKAGRTDKGFSKLWRIFFNE
jgi:tRNA pseudouridine38/39 synthase